MARALQAGHVWAITLYIATTRHVTSHRHAFLSEMAFSLSAYGRLPWERMGGS